MNKVPNKDLTKEHTDTELMKWKEEKESEDVKSRA